MSKANERQVGGQHYKTASNYQHWDMMAELFGYSWFAGCASKYIVRFGSKDAGTEGLEKAVHYLQKAEELGAALGDRFFDTGASGATVGACLDAVQKLVETYGVQEFDLRVALRYMLPASTVTEVAEAREYLEDFIAAHNTLHPTAQVPHDSVFTPPPVAGYKNLRGDQVNLMNKIKGTGLVLKAQLEEIIDMYQTEDLADHEAIALIQRDFNDKVQAVIAADVPAEGDAEDFTTERRRGLIAPIEDETKKALGAYNEPAQSRMDGARWLGLARTHLQQGIMAACRAITRPDGF